MSPKPSRERSNSSRRRSARLTPRNAEQPRGDFPSEESPPSVSGGTRIGGAWLVLGMLLLAFGAGILAIIYQQRTTRRATDYWGIAQALRIRDAERVGFCRLARATNSEAVPTQGADSDPKREMLVGREGEQWFVTSRHELSSMAGFSHLQHALLQDESYDWSQPSGPNQANAEYALLFEGAGDRVVILLDLEGAFVRDAQQPTWQSVSPIATFLRRFLGPLLEVGSPVGYRAQPGSVDRDEAG